MGSRLKSKASGYSVIACQSGNSKRRHKMKQMPTAIDTLKEKGRRLRILSLKATTEAGSGHPSSCLSAADLMSVIFFNEMRFDPTDPRNPANDRFVLSKGHAAPLLWAAYAEAGIISEKDVLTLRQLDSNLEGHPTPRMPWVDVATGSLGQGLSAGLGNALAAHMDDIPYNTYVLLGDGECARSEERRVGKECRSGWCGEVQ